MKFWKLGLASGVAVLAAVIVLWTYSISGEHNSNAQVIGGSTTLQSSGQETSTSSSSKENTLTKPARYGDIAISMELEKNAFKQQEKILMNLQVMNMGPKTVSALKTDKDLFDVGVYDSGMKLITFIRGGPTQFPDIVTGNPTQFPGTVIEKITLKPGESITETIAWDGMYISKAGDRKALQPGTYELQGILKGIAVMDMSPLLVRPLEPWMLKTDPLMITITA